MITMLREKTKKARAIIGTGLFSFFRLFDIRDLFVFGGLSMLGGGLGMFQPWVGLSVSGALLMALGLGWLTRRPVR